MGIIFQHSTSSHQKPEVMKPNLIIYTSLVLLGLVKGQNPDCGGVWNGRGCGAEDRVDVGRGSGSCNTDCDCPCCAPFCSRAGYCQNNAGYWSFQTGPHTYLLISALFPIGYGNQQCSSRSTDQDADWNEEDYLPLDLDDLPPLLPYPAVAGATTRFPHGTGALSQLQRRRYTRKPRCRPPRRLKALRRNGTIVYRCVKPKKLT